MELLSKLYKCMVWRKTQKATLLILVCIFIGVFMKLITMGMSTSLRVEDYSNSQLLSNLFGSIGSDKVSRLSLMKKDISYTNEDCRIRRFNDSSGPDPRVSCKRKRPARDSCKDANDLFFAQPKPSCSHQQTFNICQINDMNGSMSVSCSAICNDTVQLCQVNAENGQLLCERFQKTRDLEKRITSLIKQPTEAPNFGFCFIECKAVNKSNIEVDAKQLLLLPPQVNASDVPKTSGENKVNINWIWLDSTSYSHFMRSMPATIGELKKIPKEKTGHVFSYNMLQGFYSHTGHTMNALLGGIISGSSTSPIPIPIFKRYNDAKYDVFWVEDMCWDIREWGLQNLLNLNGIRHTGWKKIKERLKEAGINRWDLNHATCKVLKDNGLDEMYQPEPVCYNGHGLHSYPLTYLSELQKQLLALGKPFFHFMSTDIAHEESGRRIQALDTDLANFIHSISTRKNMLTILFGDHGMPYGHFFSKSDEARVEIYNPLLMILASKDIPEKLGADKMKALAVNQDRLVSVLDLHYALHTLAPGGSIAVANKHTQYDFNPLGLFAPINASRTCDSIPRLRPNTCICDEYDYSVANDTRQALTAVFALGDINNSIQRSFRSNHKEAKSSFGSCQRLVGKWISNVRIHVEKNKILTTLDIGVRAYGTDEYEESFFISIETSPSRMTITGIERTSAYLLHSKCSDAVLKYCLCEYRKSEKPSYEKTIPWHVNYPVSFGHIRSINNLNNTCIYVHETRTESGFSLEASSECPKEHFKLEVDADIMVNVYTSNPLPGEFELRPGDMTFMLVFVQKISNEKWDVHFTIKYKEVS